MSRATDTRTTGTLSWVDRVYAQENTAPPTAKTDGTTSLGLVNTGHATVKTDETHQFEAVTSVLTVAPAVLVVTREPALDATPPIRLAVNRGTLMTVGHYHGYPLLPLKPGIATAEGAVAWRTFTKTADDNMLALAAQAARAIWSDDPMTHDLTYVERADDDTEPCRNQDGVCLDSTHEHFDDFFDDHRAEQEDRYLEHGVSAGAA